jgi:hypothetical protein
MSVLYSTASTVRKTVPGIVDFSGIRPHQLKIAIVFGFNVALSIFWDLGTMFLCFCWFCLRLSVYDVNLFRFMQSTPTVVIYLGYPAMKFFFTYKKGGVADPGCLSRIRLFSIPDPNFSIPDPHQRIEYFNPQKMLSKL